MKSIIEKPEKFIPEQLNVEKAVRNFTITSYRPFGLRDHVNVLERRRLGKVQTKLGLIMMLQKFRFELEDCHKNRDIKFDPKTFLIFSFGGIHLRVFLKKIICCKFN